MSANPENGSFAAGVNLVSAKRLDLAEPFLRRALATDPEHAHAHALLAWCLAGRGALDEGVAEGREAVRLAPDVTWSHRALANALRARGRLRDAERSARTAIGKHPAADDFALLAEILWSRGQLDAAMRAAVAGLAIDPSSAGCLNVRAMVLLDSGRVEEARDVAGAALISAPESAMLHNNLGIALLLARRRDEAVAELTEALRLDPALRMAQGNLESTHGVPSGGNMSVAIAVKRLRAQSTRRQMLLVLAFIAAGIVAPVALVVAALIGFLSVANHRIARRVPSLVRLGGFVAFLTLILVCPAILFGLDGLLVWLGGLAAAMCLASAAASENSPPTLYASLAMAGLIAALSTAIWYGDPKAGDLQLAFAFLSLASISVVAYLQDRIHPDPDCGDQGTDADELLTEADWEREFGL